MQCNIFEVKGSIGLESTLLRSPRDVKGGCAKHKDEKSLGNPSNLIKLTAMMVSIAWLFYDNGIPFARKQNFPVIR
jgi:hypothetical protein